MIVSIDLYLFYCQTVRMVFESKKEKFVDRRIWKNYGTYFSILSAIAEVKIQQHQEKKA